jgi:hypothetical protein
MSLDVDEDSGRALSAAALFTIVWDALAEVLGTAAVAAIVRRAAGRAAADSPELVDLVVLREKLDYRFTLPPGWSENTECLPPALTALFAELARLLVELTGTIVIRRLEQIPQLRAHGLVWRGKEAN